MAAATFTAKDLASECGTDGRTIRKFLRGHLPAEEQPGQGGRYAFTKGEVTKIKKAFLSSSKTTDESTTTKPKSKKAKKDKVPDLTFMPDDDEDEVEDIDEEAFLTDDEPVDFEDADDE
jgi:hypothetical protein